MSSMWLWRGVKVALVAAVCVMAHPPLYEGKHRV